MPKLVVISTAKFKKGLARCLKRGYDHKLIKSVIDLLQNGENCPQNTETTH